MANIASLLKIEITRLARKEVTAQLKDLRAERLKQKKVVAGLRKRIEVLEKNQGKLGKIAKVSAKAAVSEEEDGTRFWITAKGVRALRAKLKISQTDFGMLIGVTGQTVYQWERSEGKLNVRNAQKAPITEVRQMGVKDAQARLESMGATPKSKRGRKPGSTLKKSGDRIPVASRGPGRSKKKRSPGRPPKK
jgi:DNA-binding transcriptional regulator YiaG